MNYIGSKYKLLPFIYDSIRKIVGSSTHFIFCDLFAGTGAVGVHFKKNGYRIIANDLQYYSYVLNRHYIGNYRKLTFDGLNKDIPDLTNSDDKSECVCRYLQKIDGLCGFIYKNYCPSDSNNENRLYFTTENGMKCDAIRQKIEFWKKEKKVTDDEYYFLLATLLESIDKRANTASVYGAFLKKYKKSAQKQLEYKKLPLFCGSNNHNVYNKNANELIREISTDILYLDPPYNTRQYAANYHILETIAKGDNPIIKNKTGLREWKKQRSDYCSREKVAQVFDDLISHSNTKYIFLSYNNEGLLSSNEIEKILNKRGKYGSFNRTYGRFKADKNEKHTTNTTIEYLHYVICK